MPSLQSGVSGLHRPQVGSRHDLILRGRLSFNVCLFVCFRLHLELSPCGAQLDSNLSCPFCPKSMRLEPLREHLLTSHLKESASFKCRQCSFKTLGVRKSTRELISHVNFVHKIQPTAVQGRSNNRRVDDLSGGGKSAAPTLREILEAEPPVPWPQTLEPLPPTAADLGEVDEDGAPLKKAPPQQQKIRIVAEPRKAMLNWKDSGGSPITLSVERDKMRYERIFQIFFLVFFPVHRLYLFFSRERVPSNDDDIQILDSVQQSPSVPCISNVRSIRSPSRETGGNRCSSPSNRGRGDDSADPSVITVPDDEDNDDFSGIQQFYLTSATDSTNMSGN